MFRLNTELFAKKLAFLPFFVPTSDTIKEEFEEKNFEYFSEKQNCSIVPNPLLR